MKISKTSCRPLKGQYYPNEFSNWFVPIKLKGLPEGTNPGGSSIWTDGTNIYWGSYQLDGDTWKRKTWKGSLTSTDGNYIWSDGTNIYYSDGTKQYVLNGDTWEVKTWQGLTNFAGYDVWTDGTNTYYSSNSNQYVLNGDTWERKTWGGLYSNYLKSGGIWTDEINIYYSDGSTQYVLDNGVWVSKTWKGTPPNQGTVWGDGTNIYWKNVRITGDNPDYTTYILQGDTWNKSNICGIGEWYFPESIWTDGTNIYQSSGTRTFILAPATAKCYTRTSDKWYRSGWLGKPYTPSPIEVATEREMNTLVTTAKVGTVCKYIGTTTDTYENGGLYIVEAVSE